MAKVPFSTIVRLFTTPQRCLSVIAVMVDGIESYRFLDQAIENDEPYSVLFESVFHNRVAVDEYFEAYRDELRVANYKPSHILETLKHA